MKHQNQYKRFRRTKKEIQIGLTKKDAKRLR